MIGASVVEKSCKSGAFFTLGALPPQIAGLRIYREGCMAVTAICRRCSGDF
jgi:hypothetical protein